MPLGEDKQYDESWVEQDKIRRRQQLRERLKLENLEKRYSPFQHLEGILMTDPSVDRYAELRRYGRVPGAPWKPSLFFSLAAAVFLPIIAVYKVIEWERRDYLAGCANGDIPYEQRDAHNIV